MQPREAPETRGDGRIGNSGAAPAWEASIRISQEGWQRSALTQHSKGRVHHGSSRVFRTSCASGKLLLPPPDEGFGLWVSFGAFCWALGKKPMGSGGNQPRRSQPGWSCSLGDGTSGFPELFITSPCSSHNQGTKLSRGASIPSAKPGSFPKQGHLPSPGSSKHDHVLNLAAKGRSGLPGSAEQDLRLYQPHLGLSLCQPLSLRNLNLWMKIIQTVRLSPC